MEQDLRKKFEEFKNCTLDSINSIQNDEFDSIHNFMLKRQEILDSINNIKPYEAECKDIATELDLQSLEEKLSEIIQKKMIELKQNINILEKNKIAANSYNKATFKKANIFSKKI